MAHVPLLCRVCFLGWAALLVSVAGLAAKPVEPVPIGRRITHPGGAAIVFNSIAFSDDSIVVSATLSNPTSREISLNRGRSLVLDDGAHGVYRLNPPLDNPELQVPPHMQATAALVFVGRLAPSARQLTLSANAGIGTADNPYDAAPLFRAELPVPSPAAAAGRHQADHPDGAAIEVRRLAVGPGGCTVSLSATNGNDRTIVLNQDRSLALSDGHRATAPLKPAAENAELVVPPGDRLDAELLFDCRTLDTNGTLTLSTNHGTGGTADNPYDTLPVFSLTLAPERLAGDAAAPAVSHASVVPIARSHLGEPEAVSAAASALPAAASAVAPAPPNATTTPPTGPPPSLLHKPSPVRTPKTVPQLETALHAARAERGLRIILPADTLFGSAPDTLDPAALPLLDDVAALIAATHPHAVVVAGHTDASGDDDRDLALSKERAHAVATWLEAHTRKMHPRVVEKSYGRTRPMAANHEADGSDNPAGRAQNRRVEVMLRR
jgi:outer membrane protein OmpA-like peptidoglycan-associated protein